MSDLALASFSPSRGAMLTATPEPDFKSAHTFQCVEVGLGETAPFLD